MNKVHNHVYLLCVDLLYVNNSSITNVYWRNNMASALTQELQEIIDLVNLACDKLLSMSDELETAISGYTPNINLLDKAINLTEELRGVLPILIRRIPRSYTSESYDRGASKLENRIKRLMKK